MNWGSNETPKQNKTKPSQPRILVKTKAECFSRHRKAEKSHYQKTCMTKNVIGSPSAEGNDTI
jgi:hypothetical protein